MAIICLCKNNLVLPQIISKRLLHFMLFPHIWEVTAAGTTEPLRFVSDCKLSKWAPLFQTMCMHTHTVSTGMAAIFWVVPIYKANTSCWLDTHLRTGTNCCGGKLHEILATWIKIFSSLQHLSFFLMCFKNMFSAIIEFLKSYCYTIAPCIKALHFLCVYCMVFLLISQMLPWPTACLSTVCFNIQQKSTILWLTHYMKLYSIILYGWQSAYR